FRRHNLHIVNYSIPVRCSMSLSELRPHLYTIPEQPDWIPYRTSYYREDWGFCIAQRHLEQMQDGEYEVCIDSTLAPGSLTYGELFLSGQISDEILISTHSCHPSLCNDNLSGVAVATLLAKYLMNSERHHSFRFLFIPGTIGAIAWLSLNEKRLRSIKHGLVLTCLGDSGYMHYKQSRQGDAPIDRVISHVLKHSGNQYEILEFSPYGYDERQYCSPGINLAVGCLMRTPHGRFPEYHSSADNLQLMNRASLRDSLRTCSTAIEILETNRKYLNRNP